MKTISDLCISLLLLLWSVWRCLDGGVAMCFSRHGPWQLATWHRAALLAACRASAFLSSAAGRERYHTLPHVTRHGCPFPFPGCSFLAALVQVLRLWPRARPAEACLSPTLRAGHEQSWMFSCFCLVSHEHTTWFTLISPVTCSTFFQKCKAVLAKNTHIKCSRSCGHSSKMLINFENLTQPGHETEGRTFVVGTDFQKFTTVLFFAGFCADVARQLRGRCGKQEALLMGP